MSENDLKRTIKSIEKNANLDNLSQATKMADYITNHISKKATREQAETLDADLRDMKSNGKIDHMKLQSDIASLFMFA